MKAYNPPNLRDFDAAIFDLDGTLLDTGPELVDACAGALAIQYCGHGGIAMVQAHIPDIGEEQLQLIITDFLACYDRNLGQNTVFSPGAQAVVEHFEQRSCPVAIVTNKRTSLTLKLLERLGLTGRFDPVVCRDTFAEPKPNPMGILYCVERLGMPKSRILWFGDSSTDGETGRNAQLPTVLVESGYTPVVEMEGLGDYRVRSLADIAV
jgi:HAD superfamily hydrolase (TIGR01509 family)